MLAEAGTMILDHVGVAVRSIERSLEHWQTVFGYRQATEIVTNSRQKVRVVFLDRPGSLQVKLIEPTDASSPIHAFALRGGGLHHLCFRCESVDEELVRLEALGLRVIAPPQPGEAFEGETIAFVYAGDGLNVELIDTLRRAARLPDGPATPGATEAR
jgi:methylmalonyl-CoA/ethylmalonyl-CoA epimerase